ncbi:MAG: PAS domain S-box protein, partial [Acholeplasmataceae bacterium]|nr:PAS domain S-box protein [Acholeplasmataceae bacterium]
FHIFYMSPNAIALLKADETFAEVNPSFTLMSGFTKEEAIGKSVADLGGWVHLEDRQKILQMLNAWRIMTR